MNSVQRAHRSARTRRMAVLLTSALLVLALPACDEEGDTIVNNYNGIDCGLIRADLDGDWFVTLTLDSAFLQNCDDPSWDGTVVDVPAGTVAYTNVVSFASPSGASFSAVGAGPIRGNELLASIEADSCLALVQVWQEDDQGWVQCLGTLDRVNNLINTICDSFDVDSNLDGAGDVACDLDHSFQASVATP